MFAKLYGPDDDQILVKIDDGDEGPEVRLFFTPAGLGVCSFALQFKDTDDVDAWDKASKVFEVMTQERAEEYVAGIKRTIGATPLAN